MKKIFVLAVTLFTLSSVFAQPGRYHQRHDGRDYGKTDNRRYDRDDDRRYDRDHDRRNDRYTLTRSERDRLVKQINRDYDKPVKAVKKIRSLRFYEKDRKGRMLNAQRNQKIREVNARVAGKNNRRYDMARSRRW